MGDKIMENENTQYSYKDLSFVVGIMNIAKNSYTFADELEYIGKIKSITKTGSKTSFVAEYNYMLNDRVGAHGEFTIDIAFVPLSNEEVIKGKVALKVEERHENLNIFDYEKSFTISSMPSEDNQKYFLFITDGHPEFWITTDKHTNNLNDGLPCGYNMIRADKFKVQNANKKEIKF